MPGLIIEVAVLALILVQQVQARRGTRPHLGPDGNVTAVLFLPG
jgi:hypothetical protein